MAAWRDHRITGISTPVDSTYHRESELFRFLSRRATDVRFIPDPILLLVVGIAAACGWKRLFRKSPAPHSAHPRESGDPSPNLWVNRALDSRFRGNERRECACMRKRSPVASLTGTSGSGRP